MKKFMTIALAFILMFCLTGCISINIDGNNSNYGEYSDPDKYSVGNFEYDGTNIEKIDINWVGGKVTVIESDSSDLSVSENGEDLKDSEKLHYRINGNTLTIHYCKSGYVGVIGNENKQLTVEVPKNIELSVDGVSCGIEADTLTQKKLYVECVSGNVVINKIECEKVDINGVSGDISINGITANRLNVENVSGDIELSGVSCDEIDIYSVSGRIETDIERAEDMDFETVSGKINVTLNNVGATVKTKTTSGKISVDGATVSGNNYVFGDGGSDLSIKTVSGNITVNYKEN